MSDTEVVDADGKKPEDKPPVPHRGRFASQLFAQAPLVASVTVTVLFVAIIGSLFLPYLFGYQSDSTLLRELASLDQARGLITFLVAVTTVGIALILIVFVTVTSDSAIKDKFILGKEIFTGLVGILGTIVGFYFGSASTPSSLAGPKIEAVQVEPSTAKAGEKFKVHVKTAGAKMPLQYTISIKSTPPIEPRTNSAAKDEFSEEFTVPSGAAAGSSIEVEVSIKDKAGSAASSKLLPSAQLKVGS